MTQETRQQIISKIQKRSKAGKVEGMGRKERGNGTG